MVIKKRAFLFAIPSVDPLADQFTSWSSYVYTLANLINLIDPTGMSAEDQEPVVNDDGSTSYVAEPGDDINTFVGLFDVSIEETQQTSYILVTSKLKIDLAKKTNRLRMAFYQ